MKCDVIAEGIVNAAKGVGIKVPLIVRLEGTNVERGKQLLQESGINLITAGMHCLLIIVSCCSLHRNC